MWDKEKSKCGEGKPISHDSLCKGFKGHFLRFYLLGFLFVQSCPLQCHKLYLEGLFVTGHNSLAWQSPGTPVYLYVLKILFSLPHNTCLKLLNFSSCTHQGCMSNQTSGLFCQSSCATQFKKDTVFRQSPVVEIFALPATHWNQDRAWIMAEKVPRPRFNACAVWDSISFWGRKAQTGEGTSSPSPPFSYDTL